ncbi:MAG: hypothetical protein AAGJ46_18315 [Planctomycetota bacterium]
MLDQLEEPALLLLPTLLTIAGGWGAIYFVRVAAELVRSGRTHDSTGSPIEGTDKPGVYLLQILGLILMAGGCATIAFGPIVALLFGN